MFAQTIQRPAPKAIAAALLAAALVAPWSGPAHASSHREAPFIATMPQVDGTDFYMFNSYEPGRSGFVTLVANYLPLQDGYGGPNYFHLDPNALYEIHIVNDGGAVENITFQFKFQNTLDDNQFVVGGKNVSIPLVQNGSGDVATSNSPALNVHEKFTLNVIYGPRAAGTPMPVQNTTSPRVAPSAPYASPRKTRPSSTTNAACSRALTARHLQRLPWTAAGRSHDRRAIFGPVTACILVVCRFNAT